MMSFRYSALLGFSVGALLLVPTPAESQTTYYYEEKLPSATPVVLELAETLPPSNELRVGRIVQLKVQLNVTIKGTVLIRRNAFARGRVVGVTPPSFNYPATVTIKAIEVQTVDDQLIGLNGTPQVLSGAYPGEDFQVQPGEILEANVANSETIRIEMPKK